MPARVRVEGGIEHWVVQGGEWSHWMPVSGVFCSRAIGRITTELAAKVISTSTRIIQATQPHLFADWGEMTGYDIKARELMTPWVQQMLPSTRSWNLLVLNAMVSMAINVANLELGGSLRVFTERGKFEDAIAAAIAECKELLTRS
jgi:hypothetical protein